MKIPGVIASSHKRPIWFSVWLSLLNTVGADAATSKVGHAAWVAYISINLIDNFPEIRGNSNLE
jgi:hypothetical protein